MVWVRRLSLLGCTSVPAWNGGRHGDQSGRDLRSYIVPALFEPFSLKLIERIEPQQGDRVLDVACGTGIVARRAVAAIGDSDKVSAADPNPNMLAVARKAAEAEGISIDWHEAPAESLPFPDQSFDVVLCQQGAQFFNDPQGAAKEMFRVLDDGGRIGVTTWQSLERHKFFSALHSAMQRHVGSPAASVPFGLNDRREFEKGIAAVTADMQEPLREVTQGNYVVLPWHTNVVTGTR